MKESKTTRSAEPLIDLSEPAIKRAAKAAIETAIRTNTYIVVQRNGKAVRILASELAGL